ncbi:Altered inheritance of mitochondria protein 6 [Fulvia fulva]|nr:Altered inheritance of mitochondria protein 6 [Fulvia fulva]KAK4632457.1 Altered inheritance of mitochondria protein 6 [Fulvia fulva]WPV11526.1 Altered inheritance of mitochondria protein 6 [Fulvia fulva]WPV26195.1 Altered inheritance of mitochondria protein 6 [Fulvia fulva]
MSSNGGIKAASSDSHALDSRTSMSEGSTVAAPYRDSFEDDEDLSSAVLEQSRSGVLARLLGALGMTVRRRKASYDYFEQNHLPEGLLKRHSPPRELRRCRRSYVAGVLKRALIALPLVVLLAFGVLHILQAVLGRAQLLWDVDTYDGYWPDWGKPGHVGAGLKDYPTDATRDVIPIRCHSHNDYWRRIPLFDAIHWGCTGVEADVWLFDEELYVGHNTASLTRNRTFRNLYVNPLVDLLDKMNQNTTFANTTGHGVFDEDPNQSLILLIDFKTNGRDTWPFVSKQLEALREKDYLTYWDGNQTHSRAVTVVGTGNTPFDLVTKNETYRDIFFDAPLDKLFENPKEHFSAPSLPQKSSQGTVGTSSSSDFNPGNSYYASVSFMHAVGFVWRGRLSSSQMNIIRGQIHGAQRRGLKARYWDTPSWPVGLRNHVWHVLMEEGADMLNVDDLRGAAVENWKARTHGFW